jgi:1,4-alpha-glucan branching enzyme
MSNEITISSQEPKALVEYQASLLKEEDVYLFNEGNHYRLYEHLGAHSMTLGETRGTYFAVWAPNAERVQVIGDFNRWGEISQDLYPHGVSGIWEGFLPEVKNGDLYKFRIDSRGQDYRVDKADPFAFHNEIPPKTGSVVWDLWYDWGDREWLERRKQMNPMNQPISVYEVHLGSWRRIPGESDLFLTYRELAPPLTEYVKALGFTHVEFMPVMEHPFYGSWGYQCTGYFAPTSRFGRPQDLMYLIDYLHQNGIGVILDWVPSHFPTDEHGLAYFDGTHLFEHADRRQGHHPDWDSFIFNYNRHEVRSFLMSSAMFWLDVFHADGIRVDAVASMLYLDYSRQEGEWIPNEFGGRENLQAISFLRQFNEFIYKEFPGVQTIAEESTDWPMVSRPTYVGGLGFGFKWDMGWMHDTLQYMARDPYFRKYHHNQLTFRLLYAFNENFMLPLSHDEVVHGKGSLLGKMPGDDWQKFANLRLLLGYQFTQPGKKLLFMGIEFGQWREWNHDDSLDWNLLEYPLHAGLQQWVKSLNRVYREEPALHSQEFSSKGFEWVDCNDTDNSALTFLRRGEEGRQMVLVAANFTSVPRYNYRVGVPRGGYWRELLNGDAKEFGGSGQGNMGGMEAAPIPFHGRPYSLNLTLPPLALCVFKPNG